MFVFQILFIELIEPDNTALSFVLCTLGDEPMKKIYSTYKDIKQSIISNPLEIFDGEVVHPFL